MLQRVTQLRIKRGEFVTVFHAHTVGRIGDYYAAGHTRCGWRGHFKHVSLLEGDATEQIQFIKIGARKLQCIAAQV